MGALVVVLPAGVLRAALARGPDAVERASDAAVELLAGPRSLWPIDTGRSKRAWRRIGRGSASKVFNPVDYASYVERGVPKPSTRGAARRTLRRGAATLMKAVKSGRGSLTMVQRAVRHERRLRTAVETRAHGEQIAREIGKDLFRGLELADLDEGDIYLLYYQNFQRAGFRAPPIPRPIRELDRAVRRALL